ncbi:MAG: phosphate-selective porin OprO/OprP, partial [Planctomycetota bacterium]
MLSRVLTIYPEPNVKITPKFLSSLALLTPLVACAAPGSNQQSLVVASTSEATSFRVDEPQVGYDGGFFLRSEDGSSELNIEGLFQVVAGLYDGDRDPGSDVALKRMRPELSGHVSGALRFKLEPKFTEDEVELEEAWIGFEIAEGNGLVMLGRMKAPFSLEEVRSRRHIDFSNFSVLAQFAPAEDHGVFLNAHTLSGLLEYGLAAYNGTGASDTNSSKDLAGRVMLHPFVADEGSAWENLQVGLAGTIGSQNKDVGGEAIDNALGFGVVTFAPGVELSGQRWRAGLEGAWFRGPWFVQAEALALSQQMSLGPADMDATVRGAYLSVSRVLTGEDKSFRGVSPETPFDPSTGS